MVTGGLVLGTIGVFIQEANVSPMTTVLFRCFFGALALLVWGACTGRLCELRLRAKEFGVVLIAGGLIVSNWVLFFAAVPRVSIAVATVLFHIQPFLVMGAGAWLYGEKISRPQAASAVIALTGLALATGLFEGGSTANMTHDYQIGVVLCIIGAVAYAGMAIAARSATTISSFALTWWQCAIGVVLTAWWPLWQGWPQTTAAWFWLSGLGSIHTGLAYMLLNTGMTGLRTGRIAVLQFVYPLTAILVDRLVYGHHLSTPQTGGVLLLTAALWALRR